MMSPDHHTVWANTAALTAAGLLHGANTPHGHEVVMAADGTASGELREFEAFGPVLALGGEAHLQLGIATGGEPDPWPSDAVRARDKDKVAAGRANGQRDMRHRIEHIELIDKTDIPRLGALGIVASIQPPHPPGAMDFPMSTMETVIGRARWDDAYLCKSLGDGGARIAFASDWPVTDVSVLRGLQAALTRVPYEGARDERLSLMDSLHAYTAGGAYAAHMERLTGRLMPGLAADIVVLDGDVEATAPENLGKLGISLTICGGRKTHCGPGFARVGRDSRQDAGGQGAGVVVFSRAPCRLAAPRPTKPERFWGLSRNRHRPCFLGLRRSAPDPRYRFTETKTGADAAGHGAGADAQADAN